MIKSSKHIMKLLESTENGNLVSKKILETLANDKDLNTDI